MLEAVKPLGQPYVDTLAKATAARWMDVYPRKGKYAGAYMNPGAYDVHPYLLLNHTDDYEGLTTFAHEWGHAMHSLLANKAQPYETADYSIFTAEIASTLNEQLLAAAMLRQAKTRDEKLFYLDRGLRAAALDLLPAGPVRRIRARHPPDRRTGRGPVRQEDDGDLPRYPQALSRPGDDDRSALRSGEWAYPQHLYMNFYVFKYATSVSASAYFVDRIAGGSVAERENYLNVLRAGGSDYPVDVLKHAGLDMTTPAPYQALVAKLGRTVDQMEALLGKG